MAIHAREDHGGHRHESRSAAIDPRLLEFFKDLYHRKRESFERLFPKFHGDSFEEEFSRHFEAMCSEAKKGLAHRAKRGDAVTVLQRSLSVGSPRIASRGIGGGDEEQLKLERFKVRTVDIDGGGGGAPPTAGGGSAGGPKTGGTKSK